MKFFLELSLLGLGNLVNVAGISSGICKQGLLEGNFVFTVVIVLLLEIVPLFLGLLLCSLEIKGLINNSFLGRVNLIIYNKN